jgi:hypothetical protein
VEVSLKVCERAASVPQENPKVAVQLSLVAGSEPVQLELSTVTPSPRTQVTLWVAVPPFAFAAQVPERVWVKPVPQPVVGAQEE